MIEVWNLKKCIAVRKLLGMSMREVGLRISTSRQTMANIESERITGDCMQRALILYTLALKDILKERGLTVAKLKKKAMTSLEDL